MSLTPYFYISETTDPFRNCAIEEFLVATVKPHELILYLWRNKNTIVIGRNQNPWKECRVTEFEADGGKIARRLSGGGAVFHDTGNLNFTFIARDAAFDVARHMEIMCEAVRSFGLDAQVSGRNDATVAGAKFSGNAFFRSGDKRCHHGTLMIGVDTARLGHYLVPDQKKLAAKRIDSVRSRVINLGDLTSRINGETLSIALIEELGANVGASAQPLPSVRLDESALAKRTERFASWDWRFGKAPPFTHTLDERYGWGSLTIELCVTAGLIEDAHIYSDALDAEFITALAHELRSCCYSLEAVEQRLLGVVAETTDQQAMVSDCIKLMRGGF